MKLVIQVAVEQAIGDLVSDQIFPDEAKDVSVKIERTKDASHGDFSCSVAMQLARPLKKKPFEIATLLIAILKNKALFSAVEVAGPGFINFRLFSTRHNDLIKTILSEQSNFGKVQMLPDGLKVLLEFVSANPTGPLHVGHGRGAAYGATLANLLRATGKQVDCEYYVNDTGRQMDIMALSVYLRYLQALEISSVIYPKNIYQANYCREIAQTIINKVGEKYICSSRFFEDIPIANYPAYLNKTEQLSKELSTCEVRLNADDKKLIERIKAEQEELKQRGEKFIDTLIAKAKSELGKEGYSVFFNAALNSIRDDIKADLSEFGVDYQYWYSEKSLFATGKINYAIEALREKGHLYEKDGALWFRTTDFGDEKDRVVQRDNGAYTYFASDIAYHHDKFLRGYDKLVNIMGSDHHGYMARVKAAMLALGHQPDKLRFELVQFAVLYRDGEKMQMSTRSGKYVTLRDLRGMIGNSAVRFFYVMRKPQQHMDFDLDLALSTNKDNPLYYIQYAHARICQLFNKASEQGFDRQAGQAQIDQLSSDYELALLRVLEKYPEVIQSAADDYAPHQLIHYLKDLAATLHGYYDAGNIKFLDADDLQMARFSLLSATQQVLENGLHLSGVEAPKRM